MCSSTCFFFFQAKDGIRDADVTGVQTCALPIYSGFEHCENVPLEEGSEEYVDSEKYEVKQRRLDGPLLPLAQRLNTIRRENPALQRVDNVAFLETGSDHLFAYAKRQDDNEVL